MKSNYKAPKITNEMSNSNSGFNETYSIENKGSVFLKTDEPL
jgi:hypothetical protein